MEDIIVLVLIV